MKAIPDIGFVGLKINWEQDDETEYLGPAVLAGASSFTAARCTNGKRSIFYLYPIQVIAKDPFRLILEYSRNPRGWPKGWEIHKGRLVIDFDDSQCPTQVEYQFADGSEPELLVRGTDWDYCAAAPTSAMIEPRGTYTTSRISRPLQEHLRNLLLSELGQCQLTGTTCAAVLEACHIVPVSKGGDDCLGNALLMRRDLHALFDSGLLRFLQSNNGWIVEIDKSVRDHVYNDLNGKALAGANGSISANLKTRSELEDSM